MTEPERCDGSGRIPREPKPGPPQPPPLEPHPRIPTVDGGWRDPTDEERRRAGTDPCPGCDRCTPSEAERCGTCGSPDARHDVYPPHSPREFILRDRVHPSWRCRNRFHSSDSGEPERCPEYVGELQCALDRGHEGAHTDTIMPAPTGVKPIEWDLEARRGPGLSFFIRGPYIHGELQAMPKVDYDHNVERAEQADAQLRTAETQRDTLAAALRAEDSGADLAESEAQRFQAEERLRELCDAVAENKNNWAWLPADHAAQDDPSERRVKEAVTQARSALSEHSKEERDG